MENGIRENLEYVNERKSWKNLNDRKKKILLELFTARGGM